MKKTFIIFLTVLSAIFSYSEEILVDGLAAKVNNESILISDVLIVMQPKIREIQNTFAGNRVKEEMQKIYNESLDSLIERQVILDTYERQDMKLPEDVIDSRINEIIYERFQGNKEKLIKTLAQDHLSYDQWKKEVSNQFIVMVMRNSSVNSKVNISPATIKEYYTKHLDDYKQPEKILINMIVVEKTNDKTIEAKKKQTIFEIQQQLEKNVSFSSLAKEFSEDSSAASGGNVGWIEPQMLRKEVADAIKNLTVEQVSLPIETDNEIYLIKLKGKKEAIIKPFEAVEAEIETLLTKEEIEKLYKEWITSLLENAYIKKTELELF